MPDTWDVVVIGAGFAGSVGALRAKQLGARVLLLEQSDQSIGAGNSTMTTGSLGAGGMPPTTPPDVLYEKAMSEGVAVPEVAQAWANQCGAVIDWLGAAGVTTSVDDTGHYWLGNGSTLTSGPVYLRDIGPTALTQLGDAYVNLRGEVRVSNKVVAMERGDDGDVFILTVGNDETIAAKAVVLATGGFASNVEMLTRYLSPTASESKHRGSKANQGDGLNLALQAGGTTINLPYFYGHLLALKSLTDDRFWPYPRLDPLLGEAILVDRRGERFVDEGRGDVAVSNVLAWSADPRGATLVFDEQAWQTSGRAGSRGSLPSANDWIGGDEDGLWSAVGPRELAVAMGMDPGVLSKTFTDYNQAMQGDTTDIEIPRTVGGRPLGLPLYGLRVVAGITFTAGGIQIDGHASVVTDDGVPITGLYAAGDAIGGLMGGYGGGYLGGLVQAITTGMIAGEHAARATTQQ